jgi:trimeric autotransporter adhesin
MTPNKQVSPAIRILRGERDASARATHLEAATRKFLVTTNERKQMSTKTNFKRIALVAVAALGMGVLSSVPSQATVNNATLVVTGTGTATNGTAMDTTTAASVALSYIGDATTDTYIVVASLKDSPYPNVILPQLTMIETANAVTTTGTLGFLDFRGYGNVSVANVEAALTKVAANNRIYIAPNSSGARRVLGNYYITLAAATAVAGTYNVEVTAWNATTGKDTITATSAITVAAPTTTTGSATAFINSASTGNVADAATVTLATASTTPKAYITVKTLTAAGAANKESVTVTTTVGTVGTNATAGSIGRSVVFRNPASGDTAGDLNIGVFSDGTAGTATISLSTTTLGVFATKQVTFYSATVSKIANTGLLSTIGIGATSATNPAIAGVATDSLSNVSASATAVYAYSSDTSVVSTYGSACTYSTADSMHFCSLTGVKAGTAKITLRNAATLALATVASGEVSVTVSNTQAASVKLAFNKATYAPGEKAIISVTVLDSTGAAMPSQSWTSLFATGGISVGASLSTGSDTLTAVSFDTVGNAANTTAPSTTPSKYYTVYMPFAGGPVTISATGGSALPLAGQVKVTATATVSDSGAAALAAVTALATQVASLRTLITTLTNLVLKIQKKVRA